jgi:hypothetical protein
MKVEGIRLDLPGSQSMPGGTRVEAVASTGEVPELFPGQRLNATVVSVSGQQALVELKGTPVVFPAPPGVQPGAELFVQVAQVAPRLLLDVVLRPTKQPPQFPPLTLGQEVTAEVIKELANGTLLVDVLGTLLEAETPQPFPVGAKLPVRVEQLRPQLVLQVLSEVRQDGQLEAAPGMQQEAVHILRANIAHHAPSSALLQVLEHDLTALIEHPPHGEIPSSIVKLHTLLTTLFPHEIPPTAEQLAAFVRDGGLHYEAKLLQALAGDARAFTKVAESDLKGLLLQVLQEVEAQTPHADPSAPEMVRAQLQSVAAHVADSTTTRQPTTALSGKEATSSQTPPQGLIASITHHLEHIESQQAVNLLAQAQGEPYQLQIPFFTGQGMTTAFLSIEPEGQGNGATGQQGNEGKGKGCNVLFLLDLEGFGKTRIDARIGEKALWIAFYVDQPDSVSLLKEELPGFRETLQALGYGEVLVVAKPLGQLSPEKRQKFEALTVGVPSSVHLLDVRA